MTEPMTGSKPNFAELLATIPDFPKPGISFKDISPLLLQAFPEFIDEMSEAVGDWSNVDVVAGIEARGFPFAAALAYKHKIGFVMLRKAGKLPPPTVTASYDLEYGSAELEVKQGSGRMIIVDDVLATGGTMGAAFDVCTKAGYQPLGSISAMRLSFLEQKLPSQFWHKWVLEI